MHAGVPSYISIGCAAGLGSLSRLCSADGAAITSGQRRLFGAAAINGTSAAGGGGGGGLGGGLGGGGGDAAFGGLMSMRDGEKHTWVGDDGITYTVTRVGVDPDWKPPAGNGSAAAAAMFAGMGMGAPSGGAASPGALTVGNKTTKALVAAIRAAAAAAGPAKAAAVAAVLNSSVIWDVSAGPSTTPGCTTSLACFCDNVVDGTNFANPFNVSTRNYVACQMGFSFEGTCDSSAEFNSTSGQCVQTPASLAAAGEEVCAGNVTGVRPRPLANGTIEYVECFGTGVAVPTCANGTVRAGPTNYTCVTVAEASSERLAEAAAFKAQADAGFAQVRHAGAAGVQQRLGWCIETTAKPIVGLRAVLMPLHADGCETGLCWPPALTHASPPMNDERTPAATLS
jgi:hypothetical protein